MSAASSAHALHFSADAWLGETLGQPVYKLSALPSAGGERLRAEMTRLADGGNAFFYAKVPTSQVGVSLALQREGFGIIDTAITFAWRERGKPAPDGVEVGLVRGEQGAAVAAIAESCFVWSRFHLDPNISASAANRVKRLWIENYVKGQRGSGLYVATVAGAVAGFLAVLEAKADSGTVAAIDLIGVSAEHQHHGVGSALVQSFIGDWQSRAAELRVGTQAANIRSLRFYERNGFRIDDSAYVLHAHVLDGQVWQ